MKNDLLMQALGDIDPDLVERAAQPHRKPHPLRWVAAVAAAAVMVAGVGVWWQHRPDETPPIVKSDTPIEGTNNSTTIIGATLDGTTDADGTVTQPIVTTPSSTATPPTVTKPTTPPSTDPDIPTKPVVKEVTSLAEAKVAIADGRYEEAYLYLLTDTSAEAMKLREKFLYLPVGVTDSRNGKVYISGNWSYDEMGFPKSEILVDESDAEALRETKTIHTYDADGRLIHKTEITLLEGVEASREEYTYTYDKNGYLIREDRNEHGRLSSWVYTNDAKGNCVKKELTGEGYQHVIVTTTYNEANQPLMVLESYLDSGGWHKTEYTYDANGNRLTNHYTTSSGVWWKYVYTYDVKGVQTSYEHTNDSGNWDKWYMDGTQKVYERYIVNTGVLSKSIYEGDKCVYSYGVSRNEEVETFYDQNGNKLNTLEWWGNSGRYTIYLYDDKGNCLEVQECGITNRNDPEGSITSVKVIEYYTYVYDAAGRVLEQKYTNYSGTVTTKVYAYDAVGRVIKDGYRLTNGGFSGTEYSYNAAGLLLTQKYTAMGGEWDQVTHTYDAKGRKIATERTLYDGTWSKATYDAAGNLLTLENHQGTVYAYSWELLYYPDGLSDEQRAELEALRDKANEMENGASGDIMDE